MKRSCHPPGERPHKPLDLFDFQLFSPLLLQNTTSTIHVEAGTALFAGWHQADKCRTTE